MPKFFTRKPKKAEKEPHKHVEKQPPKSTTSPHHIIIQGPVQHQTSPTISSPGPEDSKSPSPSQDVIGKLVQSNWSAKSSASIPRRDSGVKVAAHKQYFEDLSQKSTTPGSTSPMRVTSPEKRRQREQLNASGSSGSKITAMSVVSPRTPTLSDRFSKNLGEYYDSASPVNNKRLSVLSGNFDGSGASTEIGREKEFEGILLPLPALQTTAVRLREVDARRNAQGGGFGFILRKSYLPMPDEPDKTKLVHLIEPRADYFGPLMTGDRIIEVNGELVEDAPHETVVDLIKASGDCVSLKVASMPELVELNNRGALDDPFSRNTAHRKSGKAKQGTGRGFIILSGSGVMKRVL